MPSMPASARASLTSSSLKGLMMAMMSFIRVEFGDYRILAFNLGRTGDPAVELVLGQEELFLAGAALVDVDGGEDALVHQFAFQMDLHIAGALELFENHVVHAAAGID